MASKKHGGRRTKASGSRGRGTSFFIAALAILALAVCVAFVSYLNKPSGTMTTTTTAPFSPTTLWPYGQPEYSIEVPEGYEALLPDSQALPAVPDADVVAVPAQRPQNAPAKESIARESRPALPPKEKAKPYILTVREERLKEGRKPTLIVVIDDAGYSLGQLQPFLALPFPISIAVLPQVDHSAETARLAAEAGKEVLLHQPMQALGGNNPGPGAILLGMKPEEAASLVARNLESLPQAVGMNNHMGSAVTRDEALMAASLDLVKKRGIYYLDSLTAPGTATAALCLELAIPYWERDVFLDNSGDKQSVLHALDEGKKVASTRGAAVLIGHVWSAELAQTLMDIYPQLVEEGYSLSTISKYMIRSATGDDDARPGD